MKITMRRRLRQSAYLADLTVKYGSPEWLERQAKRKPELRPLADEWRWLLSHPERADEMVAIDHEMLFHDFELFLDVITPQRLRILQYLRENPDVDSLSELARVLGRDYRNVHTDVERLASAGVISLEGKANRVVPRILADAIAVEF